MARLTPIDVESLGSDLSVHTPAEIDTVLSQVDDHLFFARLDRNLAVDTLHYTVDDKRLGYGQNRYWALDDVEVFTKAASIVKDTEVLSYTRQQVASAVEKIEKIDAKIAPLVAEFDRINAEHDRRGGWTRAFLVIAAGGHIHSSRSCSTTYITTQWGWLPQASGLDEAAIVEAAGQDACTICYPSAPVDVLARERAAWLRHSTEVAAQEARDAKAAEKAARTAKKIADGLTADGSPLEFQWDNGYWHNGRVRTEHVEYKTERAARQALVSSIASKRQGYTYGVLPVEVEEAIVAAIAAKHDTTVYWVGSEIEEKVLAKIKRDQRGY